MTDSVESPKAPNPVTSVTPDAIRNDNFSKITSPNSRTNVFNTSATSQMFGGSQRGSSHKETYQFMSSGLSVLGSSAQTKMMKAITHQK